VDTGISWQTEGHSFGDHLSSESVSVTPSSVIEASIVLCSVSTVTYIGLYFCSHLFTMFSFPLLQLRSCREAELNVTPVQTALSDLLLVNLTF
jgi:hypothetical protein